MRRVLALALVVGTAAVAALPASAQTQRGTEVAQASRQRIIVTPGRTTPGPNAKRECRARLVEQYRPSGTVIVPVMHCWWQ
ncbi:hypothetical protein [Undibacter mobilis]|uniref:Uncharacterized protein n=1 Tax=Undibacter mobilis TaxID=2292256 RepID=A0A371B9C8_9BRAD|nr:hypothetical protein [Undibacter mobilis]RDV04209.1 hypothetical protein DXH78_06195 [Undibacter mobilis]